MRGGARDRGSVAATMLLAAVLLAGAAALALATARAATAFLPQLNLREPPLALVVPEPPEAAAGAGAAPGPRLARRVFLVMIDGLRLDASYGRPFIDGLRASGIDAAAQVGFPSLSNPGYATIATGAPPRATGVRTNDYRWPVPLDSIMRRARDAGLRVAYVSAREEALPRMFPHEFDGGGIVPWPGGFEAATASALARGDELVLIWLHEVDVAGHEHGADSPEYRRAARDADARLQAALGGLGGVDLRHDAIIVTADHGHIDEGGHGGLEPEVLEVPLVMAGAGVRAGATLLDAQQVDLAPTIAALLGVPAPAHAMGRTLTGALRLDEATAARLEQADHSRTARLAAVVDEAVAAAEARGHALSARRALLMVLALAALAALGVWAAKSGWMALDRRILLVGVPAFPLTFYTMLLFLERWLSPSMMPASGAMPLKLFWYGAAAAACHVLVGWVTLAGRESPRARLAAAAGLTLVGLAVALASLGLAWQLSGPALAQALPSPRLLMVVPVVYVAVSAYAISAMVTLAVEYGVFMARATRGI